MPARWPVKVLTSVSVAGGSDVEMEYMLIVASADEVARREPSGENLRQVMPLACALATVRSGLKRRTFGRGAGPGE
jgi:hypothetical protein